MKAKGNQKWLEGARTANLRKSSLLNEGGGGGFWMQKRSPHSFFIIWVQGLLAQASYPATFFFFLRGTLTMSPPHLRASVCLLEPT